MKNLIIPILIGFIFLFPSCKAEKKGSDSAQNVKTGYLNLSKEQLSKLGIFVKDSSIMYNNDFEGIGSLDITISGMKYMGNASTTEKTHNNFYPRYITTLDTVQRAMYRLEGEMAQNMDVARQWSSFESLIPVVVEQKNGNIVFGETLVFWLTRTPELEKIIAEIQLADE